MRAEKAALAIGFLKLNFMIWTGLRKLPIISRAKIWFPVSGLNLKPATAARMATE